MKVAIYGAGGFAREVAWLCEQAEVSVACFIDDDTGNHGTILNDYPVVGLERASEEFRDALVVGGVGSPAVREALMDKAAKRGFGFATIIHPRTERSRWLTIGEGTVVCAGNIITTNITFGRHVQINLDCTIGHDVVLGDFTTLAPGAHVSGCVQFGRRVYVGTGAVFVNGTKNKPLIVGDDAVIGAGACVTKDVAPGVTVVGVPAKPLVKHS